MIEECCRGGLALMERMVGYDRVVVIDAMRTGAPPGTLRHARRGGPADPAQRLGARREPRRRRWPSGGRQERTSRPTTRIRLLGIEADDTETFSETCTAPVAAAVDRAVETVEDALDRERSPTWP